MRWHLQWRSFWLGAGLTAGAIFLALVIGDILGVWDLTDVLWKLYY